MLIHIAYSILMVFATVSLHSLASTGVMSFISSPAGHAWAQRGAASRTVLIGGLVLLMSIMSILESGVWAGLYVMVGALPDLKDAIYFSLVTFTTLGYGDITLGGEWRLIGAFEAANGIIIFGWTTALLVSILQRISPFHSSSETEP